VGNVVNNRLITTKDLLQLTSPVILCANRADFSKALSDNGFKTVSVNLPLAQSFVGLDLLDIRTSLIDSILKILPHNEPVYLKDYELLFDPRYEIDVLRFFTRLARQCKLIIEWCGRIHGETLTYAEPGYSDYIQYNINNYDITVVI